MSFTSNNYLTLNPVKHYAERASGFDALNYSKKCLTGRHFGSLGLQMRDPNSHSMLFNALWSRCGCFWLNVSQPEAISNSTFPVYNNGSEFFRIKQVDV